MNSFVYTHMGWVVLAVIVIAVVVLATVYLFWNRRAIDAGPRKGEAAQPEAVRRQNPPGN